MLIKNGAWDEILEKLQNDKSVVEIIDINSNKQIIIETSVVKGNWNKALNSELKPNTIYKVDDYSYFTDEAGRVNKVSGELKLETKDRNVYQQGKSVDVKNGIKGDDQGGHIIARVFNGPGEQINYVPQTAKLNNGEWKSMVDIQIIYNSNSKRPKRFEVKSIIVDKKGIQEIKKYKFYN